ncbi:response regulator transcription factor [Streptomyces dysideae]|uniref:Histidine kinase n=1 Tax=Streptomyces dysideae TaxID=909626 RepID=A0A101UPH8_9ACTN|nr:response regulator transcription factor [Streptomyces dysideae]KUO14418.1 histidine kinase [Streptomyces dysideae]
MKRVLVVEPHPQVLTALADLVEDEPGCELVGAVATTSEAMSLVSDVRPDVILVDSDTTNWRSNQLGHRLGEILPAALLVLLSAATEPHRECQESSAKTPPISILKTAAPEFLRSLSA